MSIDTGTGVAGVAPVHVQKPLGPGYFLPAGSGRAWSLTIEWGKKTHREEYDHCTTDWYRDPLTALADLASYVRLQWWMVKGLPDVSDEAPADDQLAIHVYFQSGVKAGRETGNWYITRERITDGGKPINSVLSGRDPSTLAYVFADGYDEWLCLCGNDASGDGFFPCTPEGVSIEFVDGVWQGHSYCGCCQRIIHQPYGLITGRLSAEASAALHEL